MSRLASILIFLWGAAFFVPARHADALMPHCQEPANTSSRRSVSSPRDSEASTLASRPNIILINLDDADVDLFTDAILDAHLPNIKQLAKDGLNFTNCHVVTPLCGPSRTCLLRGQHAHRTGIKTNVAAGPMNNGYSGSYALFKQLGYEDEHIGVWMQRAGYRTAMIGKYLHGRMNPENIPGWDDLHISFGGNYYSTSRYSTRFPKDKRRQATAPTDYRTVVESDEAVKTIESHAVRNANRANGKPSQPFFLYIAPLAPHKPAGKTVMVQREYQDLGSEIRIATTPDLNESDIDDKPDHLQVVELSDQVMESLHEEHRKRVLTIKSVDDMMGKITEALKKAGEQENTYIFFTSDHGYQLGHNRMIAKKVPYHRNTVVPMFVAGPGIQPGSSDHLLAQIDLIPTFLELAKGEAPIDLDGKSWVPILQRPDSVGPGEFRSAMLIQNWEEKSQLGKLIPASYASLRLPHEIFTQWSNGDLEYYDLKQDPYQIQNKISTLTPEQIEIWSRQLHELKQGDSQPLATFSSPELISKTTVFRGLAEDDQSVAGVQVQIQNPANNEFWNGDRWQANAVWNDATLANPGGLISDWSLTVDLTGIENDGAVIAQARSWDDQQEKSEVVSFRFRVDAIEPVTLLKLPAQGTTVEPHMMLFGTCGDNYEMRGVELTLFHVDTETYWNGLEWVKEESTFFKRVRQQRWHIYVDVPVGQYRASARSLDKAGNYDETPSKTEFQVK